MPLYQYKCKNGHEFEDFNKIDDRAKSKCPECCAKGTIQVAGSGRYHDFPEELWEHITTEPVPVSSRGELKRLCKQHGVYAPGVLD